jgi:putative ABC transport system permease protein
MSASGPISISSLLVASTLVLITLLFSYWQRLKLEKETLISVVRAVIQLIAVGYVLEYIFGLKNPIFTTLLLAFMAFNAAYNASKRGKEVKTGS